jgi:hypothetical protein
MTCGAGKKARHQRTRKAAAATTRWLLEVALDALATDPGNATSWSQSLSVRAVRFRLDVEPMLGALLQ